MNLGSVVENHGTKREWAKLPLPSVPTQVAIQKLLMTWWLETPGGEKRYDPKRVAFINTRITSASFAEQGTTVIPLTLQEVVKEQGVDLGDFQYFVFYALVTADQSVRVLGGVPLVMIERYLGRDSPDPLRIGDLSWLFYYPLTLPSDQPKQEQQKQLAAKRGSASQSFWVYLEVLSPVWDEWMQMFTRRDETESVTNTDRISMRAKLMMVFWKNRTDRGFAQPGGAGHKMMLYEHRAKGGYFALGTEEGRKRERTEYWTLAFACAHETSLWEPRTYWENTLFEFRCNEFFCKERHFSLLLEKNRLLQVGREPDPKGKEELDEDSPRIGRHVVRDVIFADRVHARDKENFVKRWPDDAMPTVWAGVPVATAGPAIVGSPFHDVDKGHVYITHKEFPTWVMHQMSTAASHYIQTVHVRALQGDYKRSDEATGYILDKLDAIIASALVIIKRDEEEKRVRRLKDREGMAAEEIGQREDLSRTARSFMPLCQARHIWTAFENSAHPKNSSRVSLAKFLLEAGYTVAEVDAAMKMLYAADKEYIRNAHRGKWDDEVYAREFGKQVVNLHKSVVIEHKISAYGCKALISAGASEQAHGCPFVDAEKGGTAWKILQWAGVKEADIEDIMRPSEFPQEKCVRDFRHRRPNDTPFTINHPNQFMRGHAGAGGGGTGNKRARVDVQYE